MICRHLLNINFNLKKKTEGGSYFHLKQQICCDFFLHHRRGFFGGFQDPNPKLTQKSHISPTAGNGGNSWEKHPVTCLKIWWSKPRVEVFSASFDEILIPKSKSLPLSLLPSDSCFRLERQPLHSFGPIRMHMWLGLGRMYTRMQFKNTASCQGIFSHSALHKFLGLKEISLLLVQHSPPANPHVTHKFLVGRQPLASATPISMHQCQASRGSNTQHWQLPHHVLPGILLDRPHRGFHRFPYVHSVAILPSESLS